LDDAIFYSFSLRQDKHIDEERQEDEKSRQNCRGFAEKIRSAGLPRRLADRLLE